jgi:hypothetical protein
MEAAMEEKRPMDPTRRLLRVFGVKVTEYEERTAALLERAAAATQRDDMLQLAAEAIDLTVDLNARLRDMTNHVLDTQARVLTELRAAIDARREERGARSPLAVANGRPVTSQPQPHEAAAPPILVSLDLGPSPQIQAEQPMLWPGRGVIVSDQSAGERLPYYQAARFQAEQTAGRAYEQAQRLIFTAQQAELSCAGYLSYPPVFGYVCSAAQAASR